MTQAPYNEHSAEQSEARPEAYPEAQPGRTPLRRVILTTGGTGGHIFPALAVAEELRRRDPEAVIGFIGGAYGSEADLAVRAGLDFVALPVRGVFGRGIKAVGALFRMLISVHKAKGLIRRFGPQVVVGFGGYAGFPAVFAAPYTMTPSAIHEQNARPGVANKRLRTTANRIFLSLPDEARAFPPEKTVLTGNPVRAAIVEAGEYARARPRAWSRNLLIMGGSQGAAAINTHILEILPDLHLAGVNILHQTGAADLERVRKGYAQAGVSEARVEGFIEDMAAAYEWADLVVCRAGATSVAELAVAGKPSVLIPFPQATHNHQLFNARLLEKEGAALVVEQAVLAEANLGKRLPELLADTPRLEAMSAAALALARPKAAADLVDQLEMLAYAGRWSRSVSPKEKKRAQ